MNGMKAITPDEIRENLFTAVNDDWMLITAVNAAEDINTMTASWGGFGILWGRPVCVCVIRPQRYTYGFVEEAERLTLTFLKPGHRDALTLCGTKSGRDGDKIKAAGLHPVRWEDMASFSEARLVVCGRKLYASDIKEENFIDRSLIESKYPHRDFHRAYICEIEAVYTAEEQH